MSETKIRPVPQRRNANRHNPRGMQALETSIASDGWIGAITVAADGETFDGSARVEKTAENGMLDEALVIDIDGTRPVVLRRTDIPTATDVRAVRLGLAANRVAQLNIEWEPDILAGIIAQNIELPPGLFFPHELANLAQPGGEVDPSELWKGMPEFEQEDASDKYKSLIVHFETRDDYELFARLVNQALTDKSNFIWYPYRPTHGVRGSMQGFVVEDES
jgi:hypothetical protein